MLNDTRLCIYNNCSVIYFLKLFFSRPRFFTLSPTAQCNFVSLLHHYVHQIPPALLEQFIAIVKPRLHSESTNNVDWCAFLIQNLELKMIMPADTQPSLSGRLVMLL